MLLLFVSKIQIYILTVLGIKCSVFFATLYDRVGLVALITLTLDIDSLIQGLWNLTPLWVYQRCEAF